MKQALMWVGAVLAVALLFAPSAPAGSIVGTAHDFSASGWGTNEICIFCHTPHNANTTVANSPLWNHAVTTSTFTLYSSSTLNATMNQPQGVSKLCLSCHDGTVAIDSYGGATGTHMITGDHNLGTNLANDHPISFTYNDALATADGGLKAPSTTNSGLGGTIQDDMLAGGQMQCSSCHDVHDNTIDPFLVKSNAGSALCLTCHNK